MALEVLIPFTTRARIVALTFAVAAAPLPAMADAFFFSTGEPDGKIATTSNSLSPIASRIETADDFVLTQQTSITSASFTGLLPSAGPADLVVKIYRVFPNDSDVGRTSGPPTFSTPNVPTRVNSPSDVALLSLSDTPGQLKFTMTGLGIFSANPRGWIATELGPARVPQDEAPQVGQARLAVSSPAMTAERPSAFVSHSFVTAAAWRN